MAYADPEVGKLREREQKRAAYRANPEKFRARKRAEYSADPAKHKTANRRWRVENPEKFKEVEARRDKEKLAAADLVRRYGITRAQWHAMFDAQKGRCQICKNEFGVRKNIHIDHCHATGKVRALLCASCNTMLGRAKDDPNILIRAAVYIGTWKRRHSEERS